MKTYQDLASQFNVELGAIRDTVNSLQLAGVLEILIPPHNRRLRAIRDEDVEKVRQALVRGGRINAAS